MTPPASARPTAPPPLRALPILEKWDCHSCGQCCRGHTVLLDDDDHAKFAAQHWERHPDFQNTPVLQTVQHWPKRQVALAQKSDGSCLFLTAEGRCQIHAELGEEAKPWPCRIFPFQLIPVEQTLNVTMRRNCPSAAGNRGRPLVEHFDAVRAFVPHVFPSGIRVRPPALRTGLAADWDSARLVIDVLMRLLTSDDRPMVVRVLSGLFFVENLANCKTSSLQGASLDELVHLFEQASQDQAFGILTARPQPSKSASVLFRQGAAEYVRFHPNLGDRPGWRKRLSLLRAAWQFARGKGVVPRVHPDLPETTFAQLEEPIGSIPPKAMEPLDNYLMALVSSWQFCGAGRSGWTIVDGYRAAAFAYTVGRWMFRWLASDHPLSVEDGIQTVCILDRSHYYPLLSGASHRKRLSLLSRLEEGPALLAWYAR